MYNVNLDNFDNQSSCSSANTNSVRKLVAETYLQSDIPQQRKEIFILWFSYLTPVIKQIIEFSLLFHIQGSDALYPLIVSFLIEAFFYSITKILTTSISKVVSKHVGAGTHRVACVYLIMIFFLLIMLNFLLTVVLLVFKQQILSIFFVFTEKVSSFYTLYTILINFTGVLSQFMQQILLSIHRINEISILVISEAILSITILLFGTLILYPNEGLQLNQYMFLAAKCISTFIPSAYYFTYILPTKNKTFKLNFKLFLPFRPQILVDILYRASSNFYFTIQPRIMSAISIICINIDYDGKLPLRKFYAQMCIMIFELIRQMTGSFQDAITDHLGFFAENCHKTLQYDRIKHIYKEVIIVQSVISFILACVVYLFTPIFINLMLRNSRTFYDYQYYEQYIHSLAFIKNASVPYLFSTGFSILLSQQSFAGSTSLWFFQGYLALQDAALLAIQATKTVFGDFEVILMWNQLIKNLTSYILVYEVLEKIVVLYKSKNEAFNNEQGSDHGHEDDQPLFDIAQAPYQVQTSQLIVHSTVDNSVSQNASASKILNDMSRSSKNNSSPRENEVPTEVRQTNIDM
ncbi:Transmembrane domain-containing protein [Spironucleus salmonicida]|uniref:Transmembrane domain-containing protein n=1 Tax=Spironucleus salmonicida TaxID=348837 RepID=V6LEH5_9EUKA|nr:Transmembrane domain-containing protein [Spironucleus salmonicida]|eukprot:EST42101.1 Transmembrane domain-containing protein [Spironucleus salmonicida]